ncbi:hypothetical protein ACWCP6_25070 [Streptomyces sp. NPDC002004]
MSVGTDDSAESVGLGLLAECPFVPSDAFDVGFDFGDGLECVLDFGLDSDFGFGFDDSGADDCDG